MVWDRDNEYWVDLKDYPNHQVSSQGRVRNKKTGYVLKPTINKDGYEVLSLGNKDNLCVHRLICEAFYGEPPENKTYVNHIDANRQNNHALNLEWCSARDNIKWGIYKGNIDYKKGLTRAREVNKKPIRIIELNKIFDSVKDCAEFLKVAPTNICKCLNGSTKGQTLHGYHFEYIAKEVF